MLLKKILAGMITIGMLAAGGAALAETVDQNAEADAITAVQENLAVIQLLTDEGITGEWDDATVKAVMRFQYFVNQVQGVGTVEESGICDAKTKGYLDFAAEKGWNVDEQVPMDAVKTPAELEEEAARAEEEAREALKKKAEEDAATVAYVQTMLRRVGLLEEVNGEYNDETIAAILRVQAYINSQEGAGTVPLNGDYDDAYTMAWLNSAAEKNIIVPKEDEVPEPTETIVPETADGTDGGAGQSMVPADGARFILTINGEEKTETVEVDPGKYDIAWQGKDIAMYSMYMYDQHGNMLNKNENMQQNYFTLDTFGMNAGAVYEIRIGAVPNGGQVQDMLWKSLFIKLK